MNGERASAIVPFLYGDSMDTFCPAIVASFVLRDSSQRYNIIIIKNIATIMHFLLHFLQ